MGTHGTRTRAAPTVLAPDVGTASWPSDRRSATTATPTTRMNVPKIVDSRDVGTVSFTPPRRIATMATVMTMMLVLPHASTQVRPQGRGTRAPGRWKRATTSRAVPERQATVTSVQRRVRFRAASRTISTWREELSWMVPKGVMLPRVTRSPHFVSIGQRLLWSSIRVAWKKVFVLNLSPPIPTMQAQTMARQAAGVTR